MAALLTKYTNSASSIFSSSLFRFQQSREFLFLQCYIDRQSQRHSYKRHLLLCQLNIQDKIESYACWPFIGFLKEQRQSRSGCANVKRGQTIFDNKVVSDCLKYISIVVDPRHQIFLRLLTFFLNCLLRSFSCKFRGYSGCFKLCCVIGCIMA